MNNGFVYCWTDHLTNKLYIGSHKGTLDDGYICSSKHMMAEYKNRPGDFTRQIVAEGLYVDIRKLEAKILDSLNVREDIMFYNQHNGNGDFYLKGHTKKSIKKISNSKKANPCKLFGIENPFYNRKHTEETIKKIRKSTIGINHHFYGKKHTIGTKEKMSKSALCRTLSEKSKIKIQQPKTIEHRKKMSIARKLYWAKRKQREEGLVNAD